MFVLDRNGEIDWSRTGNDENISAVRYGNINMLVVWTFFTVNEEATKFAICNTYKAKVKCGGFTAKMLRMFKPTET